MTIYASQGGMMRNHFAAGDFTMAGAAVFRRMRQKRVVRIVTCHTDLAGIM